MLWSWLTRLPLPCPSNVPGARQPQLDPLVELLNYRRRLQDWIGDCTNQLEHLRDKVLRRQTTARRANCIAR